jgi:CRP/FNR family transcriptional regulator
MTSGTFSLIPPAVAPILSRTFLAKVPTEIAARVLEGGFLVDVGGGTSVGGGVSGAGIVLEGLVRVCLEAPSGRQVTVRYAHPGDTLGLVQMFRSRAAVRLQALTRTTVWGLVAPRLRPLSLESPALATAIADECAARAADAIDELAFTSFGSVRQRVARHLLDLASEQQQGRDLIATVTQQQLADGCGSVREAVSRVLLELREARLTAGSDGAILIVDAARLDAEATGRPPSA